MLPCIQNLPRFETSICLIARRFQAYWEGEWQLYAQKSHQACCACKSWCTNVSACCIDPTLILLCTLQCAQLPGLIAVVWCVCFRWLLPTRCSPARATAVVPLRLAVVVFSEQTAKRPAMYIEEKCLRYMISDVQRRISLKNKDITYFSKNVSCSLQGLKKFCEEGAWFVSTFLNK